MILRRYMSHQIASTTAIVLGFLVFLLLGGRLIRYFGIAAEGRLDIGLLFTIIGYNLPYFLELILPLAFFISLMLVFGRLYVDHEMAVINASGVSRGHLARLTLPLIIFLFICEAWLSIIGKPWGVRHSETIWQQQAMKSAFDLIRPGEFIGSGDYHLYVGSLNDDNSQLQDVILIQSHSNINDKNNSHTQLKKQKSTSTTEQTPEELENLPTLPRQLSSKDTIVLAKSAKQVTTDPKSGKTQLDLFNGRRYEIGADSRQYNQVGFDRYRITLTQPVKDKVSEENIETQPISTLWQSLHTSKVSNSSTYLAILAEFGYRFSLPWLMIIAPMMAVPLAQVRPRQGRWLRLIPSILLFVCVALAIISLKKPVSEGKISVWSNLGVIIFVIALSLYLNWSSRITQRIKASKGQSINFKKITSEEGQS